MGNPFLDGTAPRRVEDGRYLADIDAAWSLRPMPQGGFVTALTLRAMGELLDDPSQRLRSLHTTFVAQVSDGPVEIDVELLRRGRSMSHVRGEIRNPGSPRGHLTTGIYGGQREGFSFTDLRPPDGIDPPDDCPSFRDPLPDTEPPFPPMRFWDELVEGRPALGHAPWEDYEPDRAERAAWHRFDDAPFLDDGTIDPLSLIVLADTMPGAIGEKLGGRSSNRDVDPERNNRMWFAPSVDLTVHLLDECRSPWVLAHNTARFAGDGYASADMALWDYGPAFDETPRLVAYATQVFLFTFLD